MACASGRPRPGCARCWCAGTAAPGRVPASGCSLPTPTRTTPGWRPPPSRRPEALLDLDLEALGRGESLGLTRTDEPVFAVCTHGRHDACCAELGRPTVAALTASHPEQTWEVSHIGGDRFAANLLVLPEGLYYGRVTPEAAPELADRHRSGHLDLDLLRGRSGLPFPAQVAEVAARRVAGATGLRDLRVLSVRRDGDLSVVRLEVAGAGYDVRVRRTSGDAAPADLPGGTGQPGPGSRGPRRQSSVFRWTFQRSIIDSISSRVNRK